MSELIFPFAEPNISSAGSYFRTASFVNPMAEDIIVWREAIEHPLSNKWQVQECWIRPNVFNNQSDVIIETKPVENMQSMTLGDAIRELATFEYATTKMEMPFHESPDMLGDEHVEIFAGLNGFVLDINNNVHVLHNGRPVSQGMFTPQALKTAKENAGREREDKPFVTDTDLSHLFKTTVEVESFDYVLDLKRQREIWREIPSAIKEVISAMFDIHSERFNLEKRSAFLGMAVEEVWENQTKYEQKVREAKQAIAKSSVITAEDRKKYDRFFDLVQLSLEVSYAKHLYSRYGGSDKNNDIEAIKAQREKAEKLMKKMGASDRDVKKMNAIIIDGKHERDFEDSSLGRYSSRSWRSSAYFVPEELATFVDSLEKITRQFDEAITLQEERIKKPAPKGRGGLTNG